MKLNERFLDICGKIDIFKYQDVTMKRMANWEYYEIIKNDIKDSREKKKIYRQMYHLEKMKYFNKEGLTSKGILKYVKAKHKNNIKSFLWDKKWRIVIFDIPEKRKKARDIFRGMLKEMGYKLLQNSIWISPTGNIDDIRSIMKEYQISKYVVLIVANEISNDILFKKKFKLSK